MADSYLKRQWNSRKRAKIARERIRDEHGHFIKTNQTPTVSSKAEGAGVTIDKFIHMDKNATDDETMLDVKVSNPLHRITQLLQDIKNKQSTTVSMKFTIPLIALPIVLFLVFQLGRAQTACSPIFTTKTGTLKILTVQVPTKKTGIISSLFSLFPRLPQLTQPPQPSPLTQTTQSILLTETSDTITILHQPIPELNNFEDQEVLISGTYSACSQTLTLDSKENIVEK